MYDVIYDYPAAVWHQKEQCFIALEGHTDFGLAEQVFHQVWIYGLSWCGGSGVGVGVRGVCDIP